MTDTRESSLETSTFVYVAAGFLFMVLLAIDYTGLVRTVLKAIPVSTLLVLVLRDTRGIARVCLTGALFGSVCGDILLDLPHERFFIFGLVAFLVGHLFYTGLFFRFGIRRRHDRVVQWHRTGFVRPGGAVHPGDRGHEHRGAAGAGRKSPAFLGRAPVHCLGSGSGGEQIPDGHSRMAASSTSPSTLPPNI
jgi:hypothetical protein